MKRLFLLLLTIGLLLSTPLGVIAQTPQPSVSSFMVGDGVNDPRSISTCTWFTTGGAIYLPAGTSEKRAVVTFSGYPAEPDSVADVSQILRGMGSLTYDAETASWIWAGMLPPADLGPGELWVTVHNNTYYNTSTDFTMTVAVQGFEPIVTTFTLVNTCEEPPQASVNVSASTWLNDHKGQQAEKEITTAAGFDSGAAFYQDGIDPLHVHLILEGYTPDMSPEIHAGASVSVLPEYNAETGIYTWDGTFPASAATEFWVVVNKNEFYQQTRVFTWTVTSEELAEPVVLAFSVTNPNEPPVVPDVYLFYLPIIGDKFHSGPDQLPAQVAVDLSASDGVSDSRATGVLHTSSGFNVNLAVYPLSEDSLGEVTITLAPFNGLASKFYQANGLTGTYSLAGDTWTWTGTLKTGLAPSEFWVTVPQGKLVGSRDFIVIVNQPGHEAVTAIVTVSTP